MTFLELIRNTQFLCNRLANRLRVVLDVLILETDHGPTASLEVLLTAKVFRHCFVVIPAVDLNNEHPVCTREVSYHRSNGMLPPKS